MMAICIAIIDRDSAPLLMQFAEITETTTITSPHDQLDLEFFLHSTLDIIDDKLNTISGVSIAQTSSSTSSRTAADLRGELYLGPLISNERYKAFGYVSNTRIKFVLVVNAGNTSLKDQDLRAIFKRLHSVFCQVVSNPFYIPGAPIKSTSLISAVREILLKQ